MTDETEKKPPQGLTITPSSATLKPGETVQLVCSNPQASWSSANPAVATVTSAGFVTAMSVAGSTSIKAQYKGDKGSMSVTVLAGEVPVEPPIEPPATPLIVTPATAELYPGDTVQLLVSKPGASWTSSNPGAATVDASGVATGVAEGAATITAHVGSESAAMQITIRNRADTGNESLYGPQHSQTQPGGSTTISPGSTSAQIQSAVTAAATGTVFWFPAGTYSFTSSVIPKSNQQFVGQYGAILDGSGWSSSDMDDAFFRGIDNGVTGVTVKNLVMQYGPHYGVNAYISAATWTVTYCEIAHNMTGVAVGTSGVISHNAIHHNAGVASDPDPAKRGGGISLGGATGAQILYNEVSYNGGEQKSAASGSGLNQNVLYAHNWYHHNLGNGIWNDGDGAGTIIEDNLVEDNGAAGIDTEYSNGIIVRNNTVRRQTNGEGIYVTVTKNATITGNLVSDCLFGIGLFLDFVSLSPNSPDAAWHQDLANNTVSGNTVHASTGQKLGYFILSQKGLGGISPTPYETNTKANNWAGNTYFAPNTTGNWFTWDNVNKTFATWQALPQDSGSSITAE